MKTGTKEFYDVMEHFEKNMKKSNIYISNFEKETSNIKGHWYKDGKTNDLFNAFLMGYSFGEFYNR